MSIKKTLPASSIDGAIWKHGNKRGRALHQFFSDEQLMLQVGVDHGYSFLKSFFGRDAFALRALVGRNEGANYQRY